MAYPPFYPPIWWVHRKMPVDSYGRTGRESAYRTGLFGRPRMPVDRCWADTLSAIIPSIHGLQDRHDFLCAVDLARIAEGPVVEHAVGGDALQVLALDADIAQPSRQAEPADEAVENFRGGLPRAAERGADLGLALMHNPSVERQHRRHHHAGRVAVRHARATTQHVADSMARTHARAADDADHRDPGADLAIESRPKIGWIALHRGQAAPEQAQGLQRRAVGIGVAVDRAVRLVRVIDRADAGREP